MLEHGYKEEDKLSEPHLQLENARDRGGLNITADHLCMCASNWKETSPLGENVLRLRVRL